MEERKFRSISIRDTLCSRIEDFIAQNRQFVDENPEYGSIAGFLDKSARIRLQELKKQEV